MIINTLVLSMNDFFPKNSVISNIFEQGFSIRGVMNICKFEGCNIVKRSKGYCDAHYHQFIAGKELKPLSDGKSKHHIYQTYANMLDRCYNPKNNRYKNYGGRGILVCEEWRNDFWQFVKDMGDKPFPKAQIDRINNDGNYGPSNCRWVTAQVNNRKRTNTKLTADEVVDIKHHLKRGFRQELIATLFGVAQNTISQINTGVIWSDITIYKDKGK